MTADTEPVRRKGGDRLDQARLIIGVAAVLLLGVLVWSVFDSRDEADQAQQETRTLAQQVTVACDAGGAAARELDSIGACQKAATAAAGAPPSDPMPVIQVATDDQVRAAVSEYLRLNPPADGRTPSTAEVEAAVTRVCEAIGCQGQPGVEGPAGADGSDASDAQVASQVTSWCADNNGCLPTPEEIQAAVAAYCGADPSPCVGPAGAQGPQGEPGQPGPVLPEYYETDGLFTRHCVIQPQEDAAAPPHYDCS